MGQTLGKKIKEIRLKLGKNMDEFGEIVGGANRSLVSKWENDKSVPGIKRLHTIASLGGMSYEALMDEVNTNIFFENSKNLNTQLELSIGTLNKLKKKLEILQKSTKQDRSSETSILLSEEISNINDLIYDEILKIHNLRSKISDLDSTLKQLKINDDMNKLQDIKNKSFELEGIFSIDINLTINNKILSPEEKERALQILSLVFK